MTDTISNVPTDEDMKLMNMFEVCDEPDERDFLYSEYVEWLWDKIKFPWRELKVWNQYDQSETYKWCSVYWLTAIYNGNQIIEFRKQWMEFEQEDPRWKRTTFQAERWYWDSWASLQDVMKFFKNHWLIDWYTRAVNAQECKNAIKNWFWIYTWSKKCSWSKTSKAKQFVYDEDWANHCFSIVDYDDNWLWAINSFWEWWWDKGWFYIPDENYKYLFTTYAIIDHDDTGKIDELRYKMEFNKAVELGITNWTRPDEPMTRREWAVMVYRLYKKLLDSKIL